MADKISYNFWLGLWKSLKNSLVVLAPAILAFLANLPEDQIIKYALPLGFVTYLIKNYIQVKLEK